MTTLKNFPPNERPYEHEESLNLFLLKTNEASYFCAGSQALFEYLKHAGSKPKWESNDYDIFLPSKDLKDFDEKVEKMLGSKKRNIIVRYEYFHPAHTLNSTRVDRDSEIVRYNDNAGFTEDFAREIIATSTYEVELMKKPLQFVALKTENGTRDEGLSLYQKLADVPAKIAFWFTGYGNYSPLSKDFGKKIQYWVPKEVKEGLENGWFPSKSICSTRKEKYEKRGFIFKDL